MANKATGIDINTFKSEFQTGTRQYMFIIEMLFPQKIISSAPITANKARYLVRTASLPSKDFDEIITSWQGFDYKTAGKATYGDWTVSFNIDLNSSILENFLRWHDLILDPDTNAHAYPNDYFVDQKVSLLGVDYSYIMDYTLINAWPKSIGEVSLDYGGTDFASVDITYSYTYFKHTHYGNNLSAPQPSTT